MNGREREIRNGLTGERITFLRTTEETGGELLVMEDRWRAGHVVLRHTHPAMEERWHVISGSATFEIGAEVIEAVAGETVVAPAGTTHTARCSDPVVMRVEMRPPMRWEDFARQLFALAGEGLEGVEAERSVDELLNEFAAEIVLADDPVDRNQTRGAS